MESEAPMQQALFDDEEIPTDWEIEWQQMPEFVQPKQEPYANINVRFTCQEDLDAFAELVSQRLTPNTKAIWYPDFMKKLGETGHNKKKIYVDEP